MLRGESMLRFLLLSTVLICSACSLAGHSLPGGQLARVSGRVVLDGSPAGNCEVAAYPVESLTLGGAAPYRTQVAVADGRFELSLPAGEYYFVARGAEVFAYYGRNPVTVPASGLSEFKLGLVRRPTPGVERKPANADSTIAGTVSRQGQAMAGVTVYAYTDLNSRLKGMGYGMSVPTEADGRFELPLPPGTYYLLARLRHHGGMPSGPLQAGDFIGYLPDNPVRVSDGESVVVDIPLFEVPEKVDRLAATLFGPTSVSGRVMRRDGTPVAEARVLLYDDPQMLNRPLYVSRPSSADGRYQLSFPAGGHYYLAAREALGGAPAPGELYGRYDGSPDHSLTIETGQQLQGLDIVVEGMW